MDEQIKMTPDKQANRIVDWLESVSASLSKNHSLELRAKIAIALDEAEEQTRQSMMAGFEAYTQKERVLE